MRTCLERFAVGWRTSCRPACQAGRCNGPAWQAGLRSIRVQTALAARICERGDGARARRCERLNGTVLAVTLRYSDQVQPAFRYAGAVAFGTGPADVKAVPGELKAVLPAHVPDDRLQGRVLELDHLAALLAVQVLVLRITVVVLEEGPRP